MKEKTASESCAAGGGDQDKTFEIQLPSPENSFDFFASSDPVKEKPAAESCAAGERDKDKTFENQFPSPENSSDFFAIRIIAYCSLEIKY